MNDNFLKGVASYILAYATDWAAPNETNPDRRRELYKETIRYSQDAEHYLALVAPDFIIGETYLFYGQSCSSLAYESISQSEKLALSKKAVEVGRKGLEYAVRSGSPDAIGSTLHALSKALHYYASQESSTDGKAKLIEEALGYRKEYNNIVEKAFPSMDWVLGVGKIYTAQLERELSRLEIDEGKKRALLEQAIADMDEGVLKCRKWIASYPTPSSTAFVAEFEDSLGKILDEFYLLTEDEKILRRVMLSSMRRQEETVMCSPSSSSTYEPNGIEMMAISGLRS